MPVDVWFFDVLAGSTNARAMSEDDNLHVTDGSAFSRVGIRPWLVQVEPIKIWKTVFQRAIHASGRSNLTRSRPRSESVSETLIKEGNSRSGLARGARQTQPIEL